MIIIPVSVGELVDKLTILSIKMQFITNPEKLQHVSFEQSQLQNAAKNFGVDEHPDYSDFFQELYECNLKIWMLEERIRELQREKRIDLEFAEVTNQTHLGNDQRMRIKYQINQAYNSAIVEEKSYKE